MGSVKKGQSTFKNDMGSVKNVKERTKPIKRTFKICQNTVASLSIRRCSKFIFLDPVMCIMADILK